MRKKSRAASNDCWKTCDWGEEYFGDAAELWKGKLTCVASSEKEKARVCTREVDLATLARLDSIYGARLTCQASIHTSILVF
jgi:hypothetical protein